MKSTEISALNIRAARGPRGPKGPKGDRGPEGSRGELGPQGGQGQRGESGKDERVRVSGQDERSGFLEDKVQAGQGIRLSKRNYASGETLVIDAVSTGPLAFAAGGGGGGGGAHPNLAAHDALGLATDAEMTAAIAAAIAAHAATPHGSDIPPEIGFTA